MTAPASRNAAPTRWRRLAPDLAAVVALLAVVLAFLAPILSLRAPATYCDAPVESVPRVFAIARAVQSGGLPLWDFNTFAGARPFYVTNESAIFYPLAYPFYWTASLGDVEAATFTLVLLPYALHLLWAALGAYAFARLALGVHPLGAFVTGFLWALSPEMGVQIHTPDVAYLFAWLPWAVLAVARFLDTGRRQWWVGGAVALGLLASVGTPNFIVRAYFVVAATGGLLWLMAVGSQRSWRRAAALAAMFLLALGMNAFAWAGVHEGIGWLRGQFGEISHEMASDMWAESSMPPSYIAALFVPSLFGVLDNRHAWGIALEEGVTNLSALSGGMALALAQLAALVWALRRRDGADARLRRWVWLAFGMQVVAVLTMMGRYTPVFEWLCTVLPWFFRIPHAVYYRFAQCWSAAILAGIGISVLVSDPSFRARVARLRFVVGALVVAAPAVAWPLLRAKPGEDTYVPAYKHLADLGEEAWFAGGPGAYMVGAVVLLALAWSAAPRRARPWVLAVLVVAEAGYFAKPVFYDSLLFEQTREPPDYAVVVQDERYRTAADHPHSALGRIVSDEARRRGVRFVGYNSRFDNQAWLWNGSALLGYSSKPIEPNFRRVIDELVDGMPYDLMFREPPSPEGSRALPFLRNMNVGMVVGRLDRAATWMEQTHDLRTYIIDDPLPYAFFQDRIVERDPEAQLERLVQGDLRGPADVAPGAAIDLPRVVVPSPESEVAADHSRFTALQARMRVLRIDRSRANRQVLEIETDAPALLVLNEAWHPGWTATVDGVPTVVHRVNALMQGVVVGEGQRHVELRFWPRRLTWGLGLSLASLALVVALAASGGRVGRRRMVAE